LLRHGWRSSCTLGYFGCYRRQFNYRTGGYPVFSPGGLAVYQYPALPQKPVEGGKGEFRQGFAKYPVQAAACIINACLLLDKAPIPYHGLLWL
jgi:hypothetical protein